MFQMINVMDLLKIIFFAAKLLGVRNQRYAGPNYSVCGPYAGYRLTRKRKSATRG